MSGGRILTDQEIDSYLKERKLLPTENLKSSRWKDKEGHRQRNIEVKTDDPEYSFQIFERQNKLNLLDFSVGLYLKFANSNEKIVLIRCNGSSHSHPNKIENEFIKRNFHIHMATERYMRLGINKAESYAVEAKEYSDIEGAFQYLCGKCNIVVGDITTRRLSDVWE